MFVLALTESIGAVSSKFCFEVVNVILGFYCYGKRFFWHPPNHLTSLGRWGVTKQFVTEFECYTTEPLRLTRLPSVYLNASLGISRGFAFVEFYHLQDATRWMETNQVAS